MDFEFEYTGRQVARGSRPDAIDGATWYLIKNAGTLRLTYQIRLLTFAAADAGARLVLRVPKECRLSGPLREHLSGHKPTIRIQKVG